MVFHIADFDNALFKLVARKNNNLLCAQLVGVLELRLHAACAVVKVGLYAEHQGAAADIMKLAMIKTYNALKSELPDAKLVMQVHDELIVEVRDGDTERCKEILKREMENAQSLSIPLTVEVTSGKNWLEQE